MYIFKNAFINIVRTKGRNILIGLIIMAISISACIGLSIRQAAETAREESLDNLNITAKISIDRTSLMKNSGGTVDKSAMMSAMGSISALTLSDMEVYAGAPSVQGFYYTSSASFNGSGDIEAIASTTSSQTTAMGGKGFDRGTMGTQGDFTVTGYSSYDAMENFTTGTASITQGELFDETADSAECIISEELATYNGIAPGSTIVLTNPDDETETFTLTVTGTYTDSQTSTTSYVDPANHIYMNANGLKTMTSASSVKVQDAGTYVFSSIEDYNSFEPQARDLGLNDSYTVSSSDVSSYEQSLAPLNNLSTMAGYFLVVVISIGALVLVVLNIFSVRERKYEVGVLTAIGMKKSKVALQFIAEILIVAVIAVGAGGAIGAASSVPVTNSLLASQVEEQQETAAENMNSMAGGRGNKLMTATPAEYISSVSSAVNVTVLVQLMGIFLMLTVVSSAASTVFIMRYEPLKILSNRD